MAQEKSLADRLVLFMRVRDEAKAELDKLREDGDAWPTLVMMLDDLDRKVGDALHYATTTSDRVRRLAEATKRPETGK